jgi:hypothetical protein
MSGKKIKNATSEFALMLRIPNLRKPNPKQIPSPKSQAGVHCFGDFGLGFAWRLELEIRGFPA